MKILAQITGWAQFGVQVLNQISQGSVLPHGGLQIATFFGSLLAAIGIHAASTSGPSAQQSTTSTEPSMTK